MFQPEVCGTPWIVHFLMFACSIMELHQTNVQKLKTPSKKHENEKNCTYSYNQRIIQIEKATFTVTPLVFSTSGAMGEEANKFHKRIAMLMSYKRGNLYSDCISYIRKKLRFTILRTILMAIRGYRGKPLQKEQYNSDINLIENYELIY